MAAAVSLAAATTLAATFAATAAEPAPDGPAFTSVLVEEGRSQEKCESVEGRIFVRAKGQSECIATYVTPGHDDKSWAVLFFDGDSSKEDFAKPDDAKAKALERKRGLLRHWAKRLNVRYVYVSRVGLMGSSGNHGDRRKPGETYIMNAVVDRIKAELNLDKVVIAGQSGGSTIAALLLTFGRTDVSCAVLGSGAYDLVNMRAENLERLGRKVSKSALAKGMLDPSARVEFIAPDAGRRIFVIGDPADNRTPWAQQSAFAASLQAAGRGARVDGCARRTRSFGNAHDYSSRRRLR